VDDVSEQVAGAQPGKAQPTGAQFSRPQEVEAGQKLDQEQRPALPPRKDHEAHRPAREFENVTDELPLQDLDRGQERGRVDELDQDRCGRQGRKNDRDPQQHDQPVLLVDEAPQFDGFAGGCRHPGIIVLRHSQQQESQIDPCHRDGSPVVPDAIDAEAR